MARDDEDDDDIEKDDESDEDEERAEESEDRSAAAGDEYESEDETDEESDPEDEDELESSSAADEEEEEEEEEEREEEEEDVAAAPPPRGPSSRPPPPAPRPPPTGDMRPTMLLAEFDDVEALVHACQKVRDAGYEKWDSHTPYPVHGLDDAMGLRGTKIGWVSFIAAMLGVGGAILMMQWMNGYDYPLVIGGKPPDAYWAMVPIIFECGVLLCGFGTVFGLLHMCGLPRHHHPVFNSDRFARASDDRYFISVEAADPRFDLKKTRALLEGTHPVHVELVEEEVV